MNLVNLESIIGEPLSPGELSRAEIRDCIHHFCKLGKSVYEYCSIVEPIIVKLDLWTIASVSLRGRRSEFSIGEARKSPAAALNFDAIEVDTLHDPWRVAKVILDRLWESFGFDESPFDQP
jgi:hypothetical protein